MFWKYSRYDLYLSHQIDPCQNWREPVIPALNPLRNVSDFFSLEICSEYLLHFFGTEVVIYKEWWKWLVEIYM